MRIEIGRRRRELVHAVMAKLRSRIGKGRFERGAPVVFSFCTAAASAGLGNAALGVWDAVVAALCANLDGVQSLQRRFLEEPEVDKKRDECLVNTRELQKYVVVRGTANAII